MTASKEKSYFKRLKISSCKSLFLQDCCCCPGSAFYIAIVTAIDSILDLHSNQAASNLHPSNIDISSLLIAIAIAIETSLIALFPPWSALAWPPSWVELGASRQRRRRRSRRCANDCQRTPQRAGTPSPGFHWFQNKNFTVMGEPCRIP